MKLMAEPEVRAYEQRPRNAFQIVREAGEYFMERGDIYQTLRDLARDLNDAEIPYAVLGAIALAQHGLARMTMDIDILLTPDGLSAFQSRYVGRGYVAAFPGAEKTFRAAGTGVRIEVITTGEYPGDGRPKPVSFPNPLEASMDAGGLRVITLESLIELKLASGMTAAHRRRDLADVQDLLRTLRLPPEFAGRLDSSVRAKYHEIWEEAQTADPFDEGQT